MATTITCVSCGFENTAPLVDERCASCGARVHFGSDVTSPAGYRQSGFDFVWFGVSVLVMAILTGAILVGVPRVVPVFDFEGSVGMALALPVWFAGGLLVGLISPGRTFVEPVVATLLIAVPTAFLLHAGQTVRTMPPFLYVLFSALGLLCALIGSYAGERLQLGAPAAADLKD